MDYGFNSRPPPKKTHPKKRQFFLGNMSFNRYWSYVFLL